MLALRSVKSKIPWCAMFQWILILCCKASCMHHQSLDILCTLETAASMLICLYILGNFIYSLTLVMLLRKLTFQCLTEQRITGDQPACPWPYHFCSLFPISVTQLTHDTRTSMVLMTLLKLFIVMIHWLTETEDYVHHVWVDLSCFSCRLNPVDGAAAWHCGNTLCLCPG